MSPKKDERKTGRLRRRFLVDFYCRLLYTASMSIVEQTKFWRQAANRDWKTAGDLFKTKHYDACLFFCHLCLEKSLKGLIVGLTRKEPPYTHDLEKLAKLAQLSITDEQATWLHVISGFNIAGRYDTVKRDFYKRCTKTFTEKYLAITRQLFLWLKDHCQKD